MSKKVMEQALDALESERVMSKDADYSYIIEITPKRVLEAISALEKAIKEPDCRGCVKSEFSEADGYNKTGGCYGCVNGDKYQPANPVQLYRIL